jgi:hypothetical protein
MPKHVIFLIHGMGDTVSGWSQPIQELIKAKARLYVMPKASGIGTTYEFKEINYNHVFEGHREKWRKNSAEVLKVLNASGIGDSLLTTLTGFADKTTKQTFANTHVLDVILYRFMNGIKSQVIAHISEQLVGKLNETSKVPAYSIVSHSLGTAVMHDVMQTNLTTDHFPLSTAHGLPHLYMTIANVSRALEPADANVYTSVVRPRLKQAGHLHGCNFFVNLRHAFDPFTMFRTFAPRWKKGAREALNNLMFDRYQSFQIDGLTGPNPHDLAHYLEHPTTQVALFRGLLGKGAVREAELDKQLKLYEAATLEGKFTSVKDAVEQISIGDDASFDDAVKAWSLFQTTAKSLKNTAAEG